MAPVPGHALLNRVAFRVWEAGQSAQSHREHQLITITLRFLRCLNLDQACQQSFGKTFKKWLAYHAERDAMMSEELAMLIPDYDPMEARRANAQQTGRVRRPEPFSGNLYSFKDSRENRPAQPKPVRVLPQTAATAKQGGAAHHTSAGIAR
jgi:hypothetical protein